MLLTAELIRRVDQEAQMVWGMHRGTDAILCDIDEPWFLTCCIVQIITYLVVGIPGLYNRFKML